MYRILLPQTKEDQLYELYPGDYELSCPQRELNGYQDDKTRIRTIEIFILHVL